MKSKLVALFSIFALIILIIIVYSSMRTRQSVIAFQETSTSIAFSTALYSNSLTQAAIPTMTPFVLPKGDFEMSWNTYDSNYNSLGGIVTIRKQDSKYTEKIVYSDGSKGTFELNIISEGSEIKLSGHLGDPYSLYPHDYMQIESNGWLGFYDDQGYIYGVPPLK